MVTTPSDPAANNKGIEKEKNTDPFKRDNMAEAVMTSATMNMCGL